MQKQTLSEVRPFSQQKMGNSGNSFKQDFEMAIALFASELAVFSKVLEKRMRKLPSYNLNPSSNPSTIISLKCIYGKSSSSDPMPVISGTDLTGAEGTCGADVFLACCAFVFGPSQALLSQNARLLPFLLREKKRFSQRYCSLKPGRTKNSVPDGASLSV